MKVKDIINIYLEKKRFSDVTSILTKANLPTDVDFMRGILHELKYMSIMIERLMEISYGKSFLKEEQEKWKEVETLYKKEISLYKTWEEVLSGEFRTRCFSKYLDVYDTGSLAYENLSKVKCQKCGYVYKFIKENQKETYVICPKCYTKGIVK